MKTKINLFLLTALFTGFALVSCKEQLPDEIIGEFPPITGTGEYYSIEFTTTSNNPASDEEGYVRAYILDSDGNETLVNRAAEGDVVWIRASAYKGFKFLEWSADYATISEPESDQISFTMPGRDVSIEATFDDLSIPPLTPYALWHDSIPVYAAMEENVKLREWKAAQQKQVFVWFDAWSGRKGDGANSMRGLPGEVSLISNWGQPKFGLREWQKADMEYVQKVKGSKVVVTLFSANVGEDVGVRDEWSSIGTSSDEAVIRPVIAQYARDIFDRCMEDGYDGFDWDFEPDFGGRSDSEAPLWRIPAQAGIFIEELSYYFGTKANSYTNTDRNAGGLGSIRGTQGAYQAALAAADKTYLLLLVDGEVNDVSFSAGVNNTIATAYVDYYVQQAYGVTGIPGCQSRIQGIVSQLQANINNPELPEFTKEEAIGRCILTENFENATWAETGNGIFDMATVTYDNFNTGGFGAYRVGLSYKATPGEYRGSRYYINLRKAIDMQYGEGPREL